MKLVLRFAASLLTALILTPAAAWLALVCADLVRLEDCIAPQPGWLIFALAIGMCATLPPVLHSWPDTERPLREILRENSRAALFTFCIAAAAIMLTLRPFLRWLDLPDIMLPIVMMRCTLIFACPVLYISMRFARAFLPRPAPEAPMPASMKRFGLAAWAFIGTLVLQPFLLGGTPLLFDNSASLFAAGWVFFALRQELMGGGFGYAPAWGALSLVAVMRTAEAAVHGAPAALALTAALVLSMALSWACLMHRDSRAWLD